MQVENCLLAGEAMNQDPRDALWQAVFEVYYDSYFQELLAERSVSRWHAFDEIAKVVIALTASGSAVAGWALWTKSGFHIAWTLLAGTGAVLAIVSAALGVPTRVKEWTETRRVFACLRNDLEAMRHSMQVDPHFDVQALHAKYEEARKEYSDGVLHLPNDVFVTRRVECSVQDDLDLRIADVIDES